MNSTRRERSAEFDPHAHQPVLTAGPTPEKADATILLMHGRGADAEGMLPLYEELGVGNFAAIAPQAAGNTWYPHSFLAPLDGSDDGSHVVLYRSTDAAGNVETFKSATVNIDAAPPTTSVSGLEGAGSA